jgi:hypothetical protein
MKELLLKAEEVKELLTFAQELPTKFGMPLITFINTIAQRRASGVEAEVESVEVAEVAETESN